MHSCASQPGKTSISCRVFPLSCSLAVHYLSACSTTFLCSVFHQQLPSFFQAFSNTSFPCQHFLRSRLSTFSFGRLISIGNLAFGRGCWPDLFSRSFFLVCFFFYEILWYWSKSMLKAIEIPVSWSPFFNIGRRSLLSWNKFTEEPCESLLKSQNSSFVWLVTLTGGARFLGYLSFITEE